ncbi:hypothetical protein IMZ48_13055 [Candidatus Bathyarchaeota archaeon]|nr:hypothetical protein [Candidatus Bathyarchaeota archaeon]
MMAQHVPHQTKDKRRVKVYELRNNDWFDRGTGFCAAAFTPVCLLSLYQGGTRGWKQHHGRHNGSKRLGSPFLPRSPRITARASRHAPRIELTMSSPKMVSVATPESSWNRKTNPSASSSTPASAKKMGSKNNEARLDPLVSPPLPLTVGQTR